MADICCGVAKTYGGNIDFEYECGSPPRPPATHSHRWLPTRRELLPGVRLCRPNRRCEGKPSSPLLPPSPSASPSDSHRSWAPLARASPSSQWERKTSPSLCSRDQVLAAALSAPLCSPSHPSFPDVQAASSWWAVRCQERPDPTTSPCLISTRSLRSLSLRPSLLCCSERHLGRRIGVRSNHPRPPPGLDSLGSQGAWLVRIAESEGLDRLRLRS
jgi:hypothetical protein